MVKLTVGIADVALAVVAGTFDVKGIARIHTQVARAVCQCVHLATRRVSHPGDRDVAQIAAFGESQTDAVGDEVAQQAASRALRSGQMTAPGVVH